MATAESAINGAQKPLPPYIAHKTFINFINSLTQGLPSRVDKSIMRSLAGSTQGQLMATLRYFELIEADGKPQPTLKALVASEGDDRKRLMAELVKRSYDFVFSSDLDLHTATTSQVEELFTAEGVTGETRRKSFSFFLMLCKDGGIQLSSHIKPPKGVPGTRRRTARSGGSTEPETIVIEPRTSGMTKTIQLKAGGGAITLTLDVNLLELKGNDRKFVFDLIDQLDVYETALPLE